MTEKRRKFLNIVFVIEIVMCIGILISLPIRYIEKKKERVEQANEKAFMNLMLCGTEKDGSRAREYWSNNGVIGWTEWDKDEIDGLYQQIVDDDDLEWWIRHDHEKGYIRYTYEEFLDMCHQMLYGGIVFSEEMKMEMFYDVIFRIYEKTRVDLRDYYVFFVYNEHGKVCTD